jgi:hypothetical protein
LSFLTVASEFDYAVSKGDGNGVGPVKSPELANGGLDVLVDGSLDDMEYFGDLPCGLALRHPSQNFTLTRRER